MDYIAFPCVSSVPMVKFGVFFCLFVLAFLCLFVFVFLFVLFLVIIRIHE